MSAWLKLHARPSPCPVGSRTVLPPNVHADQIGSEGSIDRFDALGGVVGDRRVLTPINEKAVALVVDFLELCVVECNLQQAGKQAF